jgi:hypothetical protein
MNIAPSMDHMLLFMLLVVPGLISIHIYRLLMPARDIDWKTVSVEALFYSSLNFAFLLPLLIPIHRGAFFESHPVWYSFAMTITFLAAPICWPILLVRLMKWKWLMSKFQLPYPTAWDYFFDKREPAFVLVHLKNGNKIGGFCGDASYATSFPREGSLYLQSVIKVNNAGEFLESIEGSNGMLLNRDDYELIEFFKIPKEQETANV